MYDVIPGFLRNNCIYDSVCDLEVMENREKVNKIYERIKSSIPIQWTNLIEMNVYLKKNKVCRGDVYR